jgi:hypothetical protein
MTLVENQQSPAASDNHPRHRALRFTATILALSILVFCSIIGWAYSRTGSARLIPRFLNGERLIVDPRNITLGDVRQGTTAQCSIHVVNATGAEMKLLGAQRTCACITVNDFPLSIPPSSDRELPLTLNVGERSGELDESVKFFTDYAGLQTFEVNVHAVAR